MTTGRMASRGVSDASRARRRRAETTVEQSAVSSLASLVCISWSHVQAPAQSERLHVMRKLNPANQQFQPPMNVLISSGILSHVKKGTGYELDRTVFL